MADDNYCTVYVENLCDRVNEEILYELFLQAGPVDDVSLRRNQNGWPRIFASVKFKHECSALYAKELFDRTSLFGKEIFIDVPLRNTFYSMPQNDSNQMCGLNSLRGFRNDNSLRGRSDLNSPYVRKSDPNLLPQGKGMFSGFNDLRGRSDLNSSYERNSDPSLLPQRKGVLSGFNDLRGRSDSSSPYERKSDASLLPQGKGVLSGFNNLYGRNSDNNLLPKGTQISNNMNGSRQSTNDNPMSNDFDVLFKMGLLLPGSSVMYPSQAVDPIMCRQGGSHYDNSNNQSRGSDQKGGDDRFGRRDQEHDRRGGHDRDHGRHRDDHFSKSHPYRDNRRDDRNYHGHPSSSSSRHHSTNSHRRERKYP